MVQIVAVEILVVGRAKQQQEHLYSYSNIYAYISISGQRGIERTFWDRETHKLSSAQSLALGALQLCEEVCK